MLIVDELALQENFRKEKTLAAYILAWDGSTKYSTRSLAEVTYTSPTVCALQKHKVYRL